jgi:putative DNA-invertase from lambdoid prophage Rac
MVRDLLAQVAAVGIAAIASETRTKPASVYRIKDAPAGAEAALAAWGM